MESRNCQVLLKVPESLLKFTDGFIAQILPSVLELLVVELDISPSENIAFLAEFIRAVYT